MFENMTLREKVAQMMMVQVNPDKHKKEFGSIKNFLEEYPVGGIFVGAEIIRETKNSKEEIKEFIQEYSEASKFPLLVAADGENGFGGVRGCHTFGEAIALGTAGSEELAYQSAVLTALEGREIGINWDFSPVCDLSINKYNRIIPTRTYGCDPDAASALVNQIIRGYQENGLIATGKHFPGDGVDHRNQHLMPTYNTLPMEEWKQKSGKVFQGAIDHGLLSMMIGHIGLPAYQQDRIKGHCPPATLSHDLITKLLKGEMGFKGVAVSDALDMGGFTRWYYERDEAEIKAFEAGIDMLLWPHLITLDNITKRLESGEIPMSRLEDALSRLAYIRSKTYFGAQPGEDVSERACKVAKEIYKRSSYIVANELNLIPLKKNIYKKIKIVGMAPDAKECIAQTKRLAGEFQNYCPDAEIEVARNWDNYLKDHRTEVDRSYDLLVFASFYGSEHPTEMFREDELSAHSALSFDRDKTVILSFRSPYLYKEYFETAETYVNSHISAMHECVEALFGDLEFLGKPAVKL